jgi:catechol 2,3-dioxygenase-like lactoylglutathione lyase family enzyme
MEEVPMIERMDHINIVISDLEKSRDFFCLLGFTEGIRSELDANFLERVTGIRGARGRFIAMHHPGSGVSVELLKFDECPPPAADLGLADRIGFRHLAFAVTDIETTVRRLQENGVEFLSPIQTWEKTGKKLVYFRGPDGILLELAEYPKGD